MSKATRASTQPADGPELGRWLKDSENLSDYLSTKGMAIMEKAGLAVFHTFGERHEDTVQDLALATVRILIRHAKSGKLESIQNLDHWIGGIIRRCCLKAFLAHCEIKKRTGRTTDITEEMLKAPSIIAPFEQDERSERIRAAYDGCMKTALTGQQTKVWFLHASALDSPLAASEMAAALGLSEVNVRVNLCEARKRLKGCLESKGIKHD